MTAGSHMCWASRHLASDQEGLARQQMARMSGMQEASGLDTAHEDGQTYGKRKSSSRYEGKYYLCSLSLGSDLQKTLALASSQAPRVEMCAGFSKTIVLLNAEKLKWEAWRGFLLVPTVRSKLGPLWKTAACQGGKMQWNLTCLVDCRKWKVQHWSRRLIP